MDNLFNRFLSVAASARQEPAVIVQEKDTVETWTYGDLLDQGTSVAAWLELSGIKRGQRCAILSENQPRWCAAYLGILHGGAVAVPLDINQGADSLKLFLCDCDAQVLFTSAKELEKAREAVGRLPVKVVLLDGEISGTSDVITLPNQPAGIEVPQPSVVDLHDVALLLYTSGTSGSPKGVLLTHGNMLAVLDGLVDVIPVSRRDRGLAILPLFHILAQLTTLLVPLSVGGAVVMLNELNATEVLRALQERDVTVFCCVPQFFYLIHQRIMQHVSANWFRRQLFRLMLSSNALLRRTVSINLGRLLFRQVHSLLGPKMRFLITGGSRFDPAVAKDLYNLGFDILQGYGLTECAGNATLTRPGNRQFDSVGYPVGKTQLKIVPSTLFSDGEGEIAIRGPNVMLGYHNREDLTAEVIDAGWLLTGDLGRIDNRGQLSITGRKKEVIVLSSGKNIYPEELEAHYQRSPFLKEFCIVPRSAQSGIASVVHLHAVVVPDMDLMQQEHVTDIQDKVRSEIDDRSALLPSYERVNSFQLSRTVLPRTSTGKPKRHEIGQLATKPPMKATKSWSDDELSWAAQPDVRRALEIIRKQTSHAELHPAYRLDLDLDQDSLGRVELIIQLAEAFDTVVPDEVTPSIHTVRDLIDAVLKETNVRENRPAKTPKMIDQPWQQLLSPEATGGLAQKYLAAPSTLSSLLFFAASRFLFLIAKVLLRMKVDGRQNLTEGPLLVCPNHQTYFDGLLIASAVPWRVFRRLYFVGHSMYFSRGWLRWLARRANIVLLDTESNVIESMRVCASGLRNGKAFLIFPEGERTIDGTLGSLRKGTAILSTHTEVPIIPAVISGAFEIWPRGKGLQRMNQVRIRFGSSLPPFPLPENITAIEADRVYQTQTDLLANRIASLIK